MKTHTLLRHFLTAANLAAALALLPPHARAEDKPPSRTNKPSASTQSRPPGYDLTIIKNEFVWADGKIEPTLGNVVDALREVYPTANVVMSPGLSTLRISDLKLRAGNLWEYLEAIRVASGAKFDWLGPGSAGPNMPPGSSGSVIDPSTGLPVTTAAVELNSGLFILREPAPTPETARTVEAFNIGPYLRWLREKQDEKQPQESREKEVTERLDELEAIVQDTLKRLNEGAPVGMPSFRFHRGANLLIVTGTRDAVEVVRKVVNALPWQEGFASSGGGGFSAGYPGTNLEEQQRRLQERYGFRPPAGSGGGGGFGIAPGLSSEDPFRKRYGLPPLQPPDPKAPR